MRPLFTGILVFLLLSLPVRAGEIRTPDPDLSPRQVIEIQLIALSHNDQPVAGFGIVQTWVFAHPDNRRLTGPLARFNAMIRGQHYNNLINHTERRIETVVQTPGKALFSVHILSADGQRYAFTWALARLPSGDMAGAWMTTAVSPPLRIEDAI